MRRKIQWVFMCAVFTGLCTAQSLTVDDKPDFRLVGWASVEGETTGGLAGPTDTVSTGAELQEAINAGGPRIIYVKGTITDAPDGKINVKDVDNISILGAGHGAEFDNVGIKIWKASNIIIRNLKIHHVNSGEKDCISIEGPADHIWVDHCELYNEYEGVDKDFYDGLLDVKRDAEYITISWTYFHDSWKTSLAGSSESDDYDRKITYHHNFFRNCNSRIPLYRGGNAHIFNCYFKDIHETAINSRLGACVRIENNYFENVNNPWVSAFSDVLGGGEWLGNILVNSPFDYSSSDVHELPECLGYTPYIYEDVLDSAAKVPAVVTKYAGVGKLMENDGHEEEEQEETTSIAGGMKSGEQILINHFPNPATETVTFSIQLAKTGHVKLSLHDLTGKQVASIADRVFYQGTHQLVFEVDNLATGIYFYSLNVGLKPVYNILTIK